MYTLPTVPSLLNDVHHTCTTTCICTHIPIYIVNQFNKKYYIYIERERERKRDSTSYLRCSESLLLNMYTGLGQALWSLSIFELKPRFIKSLRGLEALFVYMLKSLSLYLSSSANYWACT